MLPDVIAKVCAIPSDFRRNDATIRSLAEASGYEPARDAVTVETLQTHLKAHPDQVEAWLAYSEDKRVESGWYLETRPARGFVLGYYQSGKGMGRQEHFPDAARACAEFIKKEMDSLLP